MFGGAFLVTSFLLAKLVVSEEICNVQCFNGGNCEVLENGQEACSCPPGYTGGQCEDESLFEECSHNDLVCFNGGICVDTTQGSSLCDCTSAIGLFAGVQCEHEATSICFLGSTDDTQSFCTNDGECIGLVIDPQQEHPGCTCPRNYFGDRCELSTNSCLLECKNGGMCSIETDGSEVCSCPAGFVGELCETALVCDLRCQNGGRCWFNRDELGESVPMCDCPDLYVGEFCQDLYSPSPSSSPAPTRECPLECMNGGTCVFTYWNEMVCSCPDLYRGEFCEFLYTPSPTGTHAPSRFCELDCLYGGTCWFGGPLDDPVCDCPDLFMGEFCETPRCKEPTPAPSNAGQSPSQSPSYSAVPSENPTAAPSISAKPSNAPTASAKPSLSFSPSSLPSLSPSPECGLECFNGGLCTIDPEEDGGNDFFCTCTAGFVGVQCETPFEACPDGLTCFNGGTCVSGLGGESCDCSTATDNYAGAQCEFSASMVCGVENGEESKTAFCTNGGTCHDAGCDCPEGFGGDKCQFVVGRAQDAGSLPSEALVASLDLSLAFPLVTLIWLALA